MAAAGMRWRDGRAPHVSHVKSARPSRFNRAVVVGTTIPGVWDIREGEIERVRPFFGDDALRDKIKPLEIDVVTPRRPAAAKRPSGAGV